MRMQGMCLLTMNDAQLGGVRKATPTRETDCHNCHPVATVSTSGVTVSQSDCDNMVCNLALLQRAKPTSQNVNAGNTEHTSQLAFLPILIPSNQVFQPLVIDGFQGLASSSTQNALTGGTIFAANTNRRMGHHCPCCPYSSTSAVYFEQGCDACNRLGQNITSKSFFSEECQKTGLKNNNQNLQQQVPCTCDMKSKHRMDLMHYCNCVSGLSKTCFNNLELQRQCQKKISDKKHDHNCGCGDNSSLTEKSFNSSNVYNKENNQCGTVNEQDIPNVILEPAKEEKHPSILHTKSEHGNALKVQEHSQMSGGNLMLSDIFPKRHSTGNTYENLDFGEELKLSGTTLNGNSGGGIVSCNTPPSSSSSHSDHSCQNKFLPTLKQCTTSPSILSTMWSQDEGSDLPQELGPSSNSCSSQSQGLEDSLTSWPDDMSDIRLRALSSCSSSGDSSGSSVAPWAQNFVGAAENEANWKTLKASTRRLDKCGFYYENMSMDQAKLRLKDLPVGSFLLRDSANKHFLYSLSTKTTRGVTSVRIEYRNSQFRLDSEEKVQAQTPAFDCVIKLIQYYVDLSESKRRNKCVWLESSGRKDTPVSLTRPAFQAPESLAHMCRKVINRHMDISSLSQHLKTDQASLHYLREYPYYV